MRLTLQQLRRQKGLTQVQLAEKARVTQSSLSQWESGSVRPSLDSAKRLADALEVSLDMMMTALTSAEKGDAA